MNQAVTYKTKCHACPLRNKAIFRPFKEEELNFVMKFKAGELTVEEGATIVLEDNNSPHLYTLLEGWAFRHKALQDGRRQVLNFALPGELIGLQLALLDEMQHTVTALTDTTLCVFHKEKIWSIFQDYPALAYSITWMAAREEQLIDSHLLSLGQRTAKERLANLILHLYDRAETVGYAGNMTLDAPFSQGHLSEALGITTVHTSRTIRKLHDLELISWTRDRIRILNRQALEKVACYEPVEATQRPMI